MQTIVTIRTQSQTINTIHTHKLYTNAHMLTIQTNTIHTETIHTHTIHKLHTRTLYTHTHYTHNDTSPAPEARIVVLIVPH